ncbi:FAH family protein [Sphingomonas sp. H39-1-10]|uniref:FAH family protein n=1 Tax=Sphingomonas pollutisoli TaxID=3030829 RepID=UPI0023B95F1E|nr:FAH family protein [Sphingomonas pollutisoli]MDF0488211.1 FAH family protein [Sphingomonas pollutisoli]
MIDSLIQFEDGARGVAALIGGFARRIKGAATLADLAEHALDTGVPLAEVAEARLGEPLNLRMVRLLAPIDLPDPARLHVSDSGAAAAGRGSGWRYRGDGRSLAGPGTVLTVPEFALDGSERPEIAGLYLIAGDRTPVRIGFVLGNRFHDHAAARTHRHFPAQLSPRPTALGPEVRLGALPHEIIMTSRLLRDGVVERERRFGAGDAHLPHPIAELERRRFEGGILGRPGDVLVHFFVGTGGDAEDAVRTQPDDAFEATATGFTLPMRNPIAFAPRVRVRG